MHWEHCRVARRMAAAISSETPLTKSSYSSPPCHSDPSECAPSAHIARSSPARSLIGTRNDPRGGVAGAPENFTGDGTGKPRAAHAPATSDETQALTNPQKRAHPPRIAPAAARVNQPVPGSQEDRPHSRRPRVRETTCPPGNQQAASRTRNVKDIARFVGPKNQMARRERAVRATGPVAPRNRTVRA